MMNKRKVSLSIQLLNLGKQDKFFIFSSFIIAKASRMINFIDNTACTDYSYSNSSNFILHTLALIPSQSAFSSAYILTFVFEW